MDQLFLRKESPPDDAVVVIRGGNMMQESLRKSADASFYETGLYLISVFLVEEQKLDDVCARPELRRYRSIRTSSVGNLRATEFLLLATFQSPHYDIALANLSDQNLLKLISCFSPAIRNPAYVQ
ncbi:MAG: hypothetical protein EB144_03190 [Actinobacteria bacterium]|nr:hypothetical protein [Actinomycetota bacterium]NCU81215.1 hypothetical protein [Acidimicrobiia bacterium]NCW83969.1 hypothetical protein [Acidimicrobiia bacterium]NDB42436.1 hypothetical protein [Actinomycetota bacterium]NDF84063.1 hypothetical protein [Actinomycetota bacterium]